MRNTQQKYYYAVVNKNGCLILWDAGLPIYWNRKIAEEIAVKMSGVVKRIRHEELVKIIE